MFAGGYFGEAYFGGQAVNGGSGGTLYSRTASESSVATDTVLAVVVQNRTSAESSLASDAVTSQTTQVRAATESSASAETATQALQVTTTIADSALSGDSASPTGGVARSATESSLSSDSVTSMIAPLRFVTDSALANDGATRGSQVTARMAYDQALAHDVAKKNISLINGWPTVINARVTVDTSNTGLVTVDNETTLVQVGWDNG